MPMPTHILCVAGLIVNDQGRVLLGVSRARKGWEFFGGQVEVGENLEEALLREIEEEAGIIAHVERLCGVYSNTNAYVNNGRYDALAYDAVIPTKLMLDFRCRYVSGTPRDSNETEHVGWFTQEEALERVTQEPIASRLRQLLRPDAPILYQAYRSRPYAVSLERFV